MAETNAVQAPQEAYDPTARYNKYFGGDRRKIERRKCMELKDTIDLMNSTNYKERFVAEYQQTKIRYEKLKTFCNQIEAADIVNKTGPQHDCPWHLLRDQQRTMGEYLHVLELRAVIEGVDLCL